MPGTCINIICFLRETSARVRKSPRGGRQGRGRPALQRTRENVKSLGASPPYCARILIVVVAAAVAGRGKKKKKKIHKLIALVKLVLLVLVVKLKLAFIMMALQTLFQFKLVVMVFLILLCKKLSLLLALKAHKKSQEEPQKVTIFVELVRNMYNRNSR